MTEITFHTSGGRLTGFAVTGHSGYASEGTDIVCAAVTSVVRLTECALNDVLGLSAAVRIRPADICLKLPGGLNQTNEETSQALLAALMVYLEQLHQEYPDYITVYEAEDH